MRIENFLERLSDVIQVSPNEWKALCPAHKDSKRSLSVKVSGNKILLYCHAGCRTEDILRGLNREMKDLFLDEPFHIATQKAPQKSIHEEKMLEGSTEYFDYQSENGTVLYRIVRYPKGDGKDFKVFHSDTNGQWIAGIPGVRRVLYGLPELLRADPSEPVFIVEGEKHVDKLIELGFAATCNPFGAGKWKDDYSQHLKGRCVVILPDGDEPGRKHARQVAESLRGIAVSTKVLELPGLPPKGDILNWFDAGHVADDLRNLIKKAHKDTGEALDKCIETVHKWLLLPDDSVVRYLMALVVANRLPGDPVWGFIVAPSGGAKTELLNALNDVPEIYPLSDLTPQTFISGFVKNKKASLLLRLKPGTILTLKDFTTILQLHRDSRQQILSQLREIADGSYIKEFGTGQRIAWEGKLGFIAGVTPIIDQHRSFYAVLGERFLQIRPRLPARKDLAKAARQGTGKEEEMRGELREAMADCIADVDFSIIPEWPEDLADPLDNLATLCATARSGVVRDSSYSRELQMIPEPEVPTRLIKQLVKLGQASTMLRGADKVEVEDYELVKKVAMDTIPATRWKILQALHTESDFVPTSTVATTVGLPTTTTKRYLGDLEGLRLVVGDKPGVGKANKWRVSVVFSDLAANSLTSPHKSSLGGRGEYKDQCKSPIYTPPTLVARLEDAVSDKDLHPNHNVEDKYLF